MGTAHFMSPEQAAGAPIDGRADLYALGVVGYLAVSGRLPFESSNVPALLVRQATEPAPVVLRAAPGLPPALAATIDRCLARDPADRFPDGEALAAALAPAPPQKNLLPPMLRAWLGSRNPLLLPYTAWSALFTVSTVANFINVLRGNPGSSPRDVVFLLALTTCPLVPIIGFHINQGRRQFRAGHTLADLRAALAVAKRERAETEALARDEEEPRSHRVLRAGTVASATWLGVTFIMVVTNTINEHTTNIAWILAPILSTMGLGAASNALGVQFIPDKIRELWQTGIRDRLWNSRVGEWLARRLGAPERSRAVGGGIFRATEAALGIAASELFAALPKAYREELAELPAMVEVLEARAAEARAELELIGGLAPSASTDADVLARRRDAARENLAASVAALEGIRVDLLRLHAGTGDLAPLTTLIDASRVVRDDVRRLADAQREVDDAIAPRPAGADRIPTPV
jgi:serine/threonine-protein kinase